LASFMVRLAERGELAVGRSGGTPEVGRHGYPIEAQLP
jgi:hypothetical protein